MACFWQKYLPGEQRSVIEGWIESDGSSESDGWTEAEGSIESDGGSLGKVLGV